MSFLFFILGVVIEMKVYLDLVILMNFLFDFMILMATKIVLKEKTPIFRIVIGSIVASTSILLLFLSLSSITLFLFKLGMSIIIILVTFGRRNFFKDFLYFYLISIILGGFLYLLDVGVTYKNKGVLFFGNGLSVNFIVLLLLSPIFLYFYVMEIKKYKVKYSNIYSVEIYIQDKVYKLKGMLDTGNHLVDPYTGKCVILVSAKIPIRSKKCLYVPYKALNTEGIIPCYPVDRVIVGDALMKKCLVGVSKEQFQLGDVDCILPNEFKEEL